MQYIAHTRYLEHVVEHTTHTHTRAGPQTIVESVDAKYVYASIIKIVHEPTCPRNEISKEKEREKSAV